MQQCRRYNLLKKNLKNGNNQLKSTCKLRTRSLFNSGRSLDKPKSVTWEQPLKFNSSIDRLNDSG